MELKGTSHLDLVPYRLTELWKYQKGEQDSVYVMDVMEGHIYQLNTTAGHLWMLIDGQKTIGDVVTACLSVFQTDDVEGAKSSLLECMTDLHERGLVAFEGE